MQVVILSWSPVSAIETSGLLKVTNNQIVFVRRGVKISSSSPVSHLDAADRVTSSTNRSLGFWFCVYTEHLAHLGRSNASRQKRFRYSLALSDSSKTSAK